MNLDTLTNRLRLLVGLSVNVATENELRDWVSQRWDEYARQGPLKHIPTQRSYAEQPWPESALNAYAALFPRTTSLNILDFEAFVFYTSSIQQDLIRDGIADLQYFYPEDRADGVRRLIIYLQSAEILMDHDSVITKLRGLMLPQDMAWVQDLKYDSAIVSAGPDGIEMVADSKDGYLMIAAIDG